MCRYCDVFSLKCNISGCGINDECHRGQFCTDTKDGEVGMKFMYFKSNCQSCHPKRYCHQVQCGRKVAEVFLDAGQKYLGEINQGQFLPAEEFCNIYAALCL